MTTTLLALLKMILSVSSRPATSILVKVEAPALAICCSTKLSRTRGLTGKTEGCASSGLLDRALGDSRGGNSCELSGRHGNDLTLAKHLKLGTNYSSLRRLPLSYASTSFTKHFPSPASAVVLQCNIRRHRVPDESACHCRIHQSESAMLVGIMFADWPGLALYNFYSPPSPHLQLPPKRSDISLFPNTP